MSCLPVSATISESQIEVAVLELVAAADEPVDSEASSFLELLAVIAAGEL